jgi:phage/plasmid-like protein (TIGR03299 family)
MAHLVEGMFSVNEVPWHGLGNILTDYPTVDEAMIHSGLTWKVEKIPAYYQVPESDLLGHVGMEFKKVPGQFVLRRGDNHSALGIVGKDYEIYQNSEMWDFIKEFMENHDAKLETAGSLKMGRKTWVLATGGQFEPVAGDTHLMYFLFSNSFDGSSSIQIAFTPVRVVCSNTINMAIKGAPHVYKVRHTKSSKSYLGEVQEALRLAGKYQHSLVEALEWFASVPVRDQNVVEFVTQKLFPEKVVKIESARSKRAENNRTKAINTFMDLYYGSGAGVGQVGTGYGLFNAITEYADHTMTTRGQDERDRKENKFSSVISGAAHRFKNKAINDMTEYLKVAVNN